VDDLARERTDCCRTHKGEGWLSSILQGKGLIFVDLTRERAGCGRSCKGND
jgi:hypothetical protein